MNLGPKAFGFALVAALATVALTASAAQAEATFTGEVAMEKITLTAHQESVATNKYKFGGEELTCQNVEYDGPLINPQKATLTPTYQNCEMFSNEVEITGFSTTGCDFFLYPNGPVDLECATGKDVVIDLPGGLCTITISAQKGLSKTKYKQEEQEGKKPDYTVTWEINNLKFMYKGGFGCSLMGLKPDVLHEDGEYIGAMTVWGDRIDVEGEAGIEWHE